ncbi:DNA-binding CsgD family transcriptional regulator [Kibdelosporangium banguiense]|uniref:DNA-binding CsgD family transcriptional regulator n=1 Tax=Kibdelosporangium banguiense TaxID=1365924 RepID=A0ABS4U3F1_9PSEU|nr:helix-turn-helix transcriptional regulator [Kibdelosporangium banguiense]MBP2331202.1 DNA-binding CsgD family transcriptional regulator [Kibdelosporangium banguiense]
MSQRAATRARTGILLDDAARRVLDAVEADPFTPISVAVIAPGGYGKTVFLRALRRAYDNAGVRISDRPGDPDVAVIVDDAHALPDDRLRELAESDTPRLAIALRPWPRSAALTELTRALGTTVMLTPMDRGQIKTLATGAFGAAPTAELVEYLFSQTGGVPAYAERLITALAARPATEVPEAALAGFRYDLDLLDADVLLYVLAAQAGAGLRTDLLASLLGRDANDVVTVMEAARATGLLGHDGALLPICHRAIRSVIPAERGLAVRQRLAELLLERGESVLPVARSLLGSGVGGAGVAAAFHAAAHESLTEDPALSAKLFAAAVAAGRPIAKSAAGWAQASALAGDLDSALRLADQAISGEDKAGGARVAATALAHRGQLGRSAELYRWSGDNSFATIGLIATGHLQAVPASAGDGPPTLLDGAASLMAQGVTKSVTGNAVDALSALVRAAGLLEPAGRGVLLPDSPAALAALVGVHCGELDVADSVLSRAVQANMGGPLLSTRHRLLQAWICMVRGRLSTAAEHLAATRPREPRDWLFAVALEVGLARRNSDVQTLRRIWAQACEAVVRHPVDLFTILPLGEFAVAAAKLSDESRLGPHLREAYALASRLGDPELWVSPLHWNGLHAAIVAEKPAEAAEHVAAMAANQSRFGRAMAEAAQCWLDVVAGKVDPVRAETAARGLHDAGMWWDGSRLAGQAAIRTSDRKAMVTLLDCARELQGRQAAADPAPAAESPLSDREQEVAGLVLQGMTYKQVGDQLFISAKTVEHHMARMRQRLGASSRSDLLAQLRALTSRT